MHGKSDHKPGGQPGHKGETPRRAATPDSQGVMNGVGLPFVGRLLGHKRRTTSPIYAHLDDATRQDASAQAAGVIAKVIGFKVEPPTLPDKPGEKEAYREKTSGWKARPVPLDPWEIPLDERAGGKNEEPFCNGRQEPDRKYSVIPSVRESTQEQVGENRGRLNWI